MALPTMALPRNPQSTGLESIPVALARVKLKLTRYRKQLRQAESFDRLRQRAAWLIKGGSEA